MRIFKCSKCEYFQKADWSNGDLEQKIFGVLGFCMDSLNPDFNLFAQISGRGIPKLQAIFSPKWCRFKNVKGDK